MSHYKRILLKLSGEALMGDRHFGVDPSMVQRIAREIAEVKSRGVEIGIVIGGGNFFRGVSEVGRTMERINADSIGMLATIMNCLVLQDAFEKNGLDTRLLTSIEIKEVGEFFTKRSALHHLKKGRIVLFGGGTGHPYFSTDTGAALRALEIHADAILKGTKVDGVYSSDPLKEPNAVKFDRISYQEVLEKQLKVMDLTAVAMCMENNMRLHVFSILKEGNLLRIIEGERIGTIIT